MAANYLQMLQKVEKLPIYSDLETLDMFCEYLLNDGNRLISFSNLSNLKEFIDMMDPKVLMTSDAKMARYEFLRLYLEARLEKGLIKRSLILSYIESNAEPRYMKIIKRDILNSIDPDQLSKKDIEFINNMIFAQLNVQFMHRYKVGLTKMIDDVNNNDFGKNPEDCVNAIQFMQSILSDLTKAQRRSKQDNRFNLTDVTHFKAVMTDALDRLTATDTKLITGWQGLNSMLDGGFEDARVYNFIGATGGFKSGLLLNIMKSIKKYNKGRPHKDKSKRPTVLFISQENNIWETIGRIFGIFGTTTNIKNYTVEQIMELLSEGGFTICQDDDDIDIELRYYGNMDIGVADIKGIVEELDNAGRETIIVIQDYIERLRPPVMSSDRRLQLADVSNQLHDAAIDMDIPIVTASQFNRYGTQIIEEMTTANKADIGKNLGMKDVSESYAMLKNFDANISIVVEKDIKEERYYLTFRSLKYRGDDTNALKYFAQPFVGKMSKIQLMDDIGLEKPVYRTTMGDQSIEDLADIRMRQAKLVSEKKPLVMTTDVGMEVTADFLKMCSNDHLRADKEMTDWVIEGARRGDGYRLKWKVPMEEVIRSRFGDGAVLSMANHAGAKAFENISNIVIAE